MAAQFEPTQPLLGRETGEVAEPHAAPRTRRASIAAVSLLLCSLGATAVVVSGNGKSVSSLEASEQSGLTLSITNEYGALASKSMYAWKHIAEPYKTSTLAATSVSGTTTSTLTYSWAITHEEAGATVTDYIASGLGLSTVEFEFTKAATTYSVTAVAASAGGERSLAMAEPVMVKYVRREIRQLTEADRERYLAATSLFHRVGLSEGRAKYGAKWTNYEESVKKHLAKMTLDGCTPYHGYDTFLTAHEAFLLEFEQALQAVDPAISAPFWDYSIDTVKYGHVGAIAASSPIFKDEWFGPIDNSATADVLVSKHFSHIPVPRDRSAPEHNGFGFLTDSINQNPSAFVTRAASICGLPSESYLAGCTELKSIFNSQSLSGLRTAIEVTYHATLHMSLGGATDCAFSLKDAVADETMGATTRAPLFAAVGMMANTLWRTFELTEIMVCDEDCDLAEDGSSLKDCACSCPSVDAWDDKEKAFMAYQELDHAGMTQMLLSETGTAAYFETDAHTGEVKLAGATSDENKAFWKWFLDFACHPGKLAQYATPLAANNDPIFWVSHAAWGRYWHFIQLAPSFAEKFHNEWMDVTVKSALDGYQNMTDCEHMLKENDLLPFTSFTERDSAKDGKDGKVKHYSNRELLDLFSPNNEALPYVYSDFDWSHCGDDVTEDLFKGE